MMLNNFQEHNTPFYYYDTELLRDTLAAILQETRQCDNFHVHYAVKANTNPKILHIINEYGLGIDCVSGGEIQAALDAGFPADKIVFAGVGKSDWEILLALRNEIFCFNVESIPELEVINELAVQENKIANVCFRINPDVGAHTHANITTGLAENKFGIAMEDMEKVIRMAQSLPNIRFKGLHFHIGSQILEMDDFVALCRRINELQEHLDAAGISVEVINVGGGLGVDYDTPDANPIPDFKSFFNTYKQHLQLRPGQQLHFELGRAVVAQCGSLITRVLYVKQTATKQFVIVDAGMTDLIRPALYQAHHHIENLSAQSNSCHPEHSSLSCHPEHPSLSCHPERSAAESKDLITYDVVGPICESSDVFDKDILLPLTRRGDLIAIRTAGAYGEIMASCYNCRPLPKSVFSEELEVRS